MSMQSMQSVVWKESREGFVVHLTLMFRRPDLYHGQLHLYPLHTWFKKTLLLQSWLSFHDKEKHTCFSKFCSFLRYAWIASLFKVCRTVFVNVTCNILHYVLQQAVWAGERAFKGWQKGYRAASCRSWTLSRTFQRSHVLLFSLHHGNALFSIWGCSVAPHCNAHNTTCIGWAARGEFSRLRWQWIYAFQLDTQQVCISFPYTLKINLASYMFTEQLWNPVKTWQCPRHSVPQAEAQ